MNELKSGEEFGRSHKHIVCKAEMHLMISEDGKHDPFSVRSTCAGP